MEKLKNAWSDPNSSIYHNKNVRHIKEYCFENAIDVSEAEIKSFLDQNESGNVKFEKVNNKYVSEVSKEFSLRGKFFSQLHADTIHLSKKMKYATNLKYILLVTCALSRYVLLAGMFDLKFKSMEKAFISILNRIKQIYPQFTTATLFCDGGSEMKSSAITSLLSKYGVKVNVIAQRPFRKSIGSGIAERQIRTVRLFFQTEFAENKALPFKEKLLNVEKTVNQRKTFLGLSPLDCLKARPMDIVMLSRSKKLKRRGYLREAMKKKKDWQLAQL